MSPTRTTASCVVAEMTSRSSLSSASKLRSGNEKVSGNVGVRAQMGVGGRMYKHWRLRVHGTGTLVGPETPMIEDAGSASVSGAGVAVGNQPLTRSISAPQWLSL